jgi:hypothetical protein
MYTINPAATEINFQVIVEINQLEKIGWYFDKYHENTANALEISLNKAKEYNYSKYIAEIRIYGDANNVKTDYTWYNRERNERIDWKPTGDDAQTIKDVGSLIEREQFVFLNGKSTNEAGEYVPTFVEA